MGGRDPLQVDIERALAKARLFSQAGPMIGRYRILDVVGEGGMGTVYAAMDEQLERRVAIKQLKTEADEGDDHRRILREAQALAQLSHPNVVPIYECGVSDERLFFAMELVEGVTLRAWADEEPRMWSDLVAKYVQAGRGLAAAHAIGLVHRDFKPHNVIVGDDGRVRVLDFGLVARPSVSLEPDRANAATPRAGLDSNITRTGAVMGTPAYMAPEQLRGEVVDARADQFSFCVSLYEALYGKRPFTPMTIVAGQSAAEPDKRGPRPLWRALGRGLSLDPDARFASMNALLAALERVLGRRRRVLVGASLVGVALTSTVAVASFQEAPCRGPFDVGDAWNPTRSVGVETAFLATDLPFASLAYERAALRVEKWAEAWSDARGSICRATRIEGTQSESQLDLRMACLERQRRGVAARVDVLEEGSPTTVGRSDEALNDLPDVAACVDVALVPPGTPSVNPSQARELAGIERTLERGAVFVNVGEPTRARSELDVARQALQTQQEPRLELLADALDARIVYLRGDLGGANDKLAEAARRAYSLRLDDLVATLHVRRAGMVAGQLGQSADEEQVLADAGAALERIGRRNDPRRLLLRVAEAQHSFGAGRFDDALASFEETRRQAASSGSFDVEIQSAVEAASVRLEQGNVQAAVRGYREALARIDSRIGEDSPRAATVHHNLGLAFLLDGDLPQAEAELAEARASFVLVEGERGRSVAGVDFARVKLEMQRGRLREAQELLRTTLPVLEDAEPHAFSTANAYNAKGVLAFYLGDFEESIEAYQRSLALDTGTDPGARVDRALTQSNIGESKLALGRVESALEDFDGAIAVMRAYLEPNDEILALPHKGRGLALLQLGRDNQAAAELTTALALLELNGGERLDLAATRFGLARALGQSERERAVELARRARKDFDELDRPQDRETIDQWIKEAERHDSRKATK